MEKSIILAGRQWNLKKLSNKIGHHSATATSLWLEMCDVRYRHIIGKLERVKPILVPIHGARTKPPRVVRLGVFIDLFGMSQKFSLFFEKMSVMIQIMDVEFEATASNFAHIAFENF